MDCSAELKVAAEAYSQVIEATLFTADCEKICEGLRRVVVSAVTCIDYGN